MPKSLEDMKRLLDSDPNVEEVIGISMYRHSPNKLTNSLNMMSCLYLYMFQFIYNTHFIFYTSFLSHVFSINKLVEIRLLVGIAIIL